MGVPKLTKMNKRLVSLFPKNTLMILKTFGKIFCGVTKTEIELFGRFCYICGKPDRPVKHGSGGPVMVVTSRN